MYLPLARGGLPQAPGNVGVGGLSLNGQLGLSDFASDFRTTKPLIEKSTGEPCEIRDFRTEPSCIAASRCGRSIKLLITISRDIISLVSEWKPASAWVRLAFRSTWKRNAMAMAASDLVGFLRAEFAKASNLRIWQFLAQLAIAVPAAIAVVVTDDVGSYRLAIAGAVLLIGWWVANIIYTSARNAAHTARRAALLLDGLDKPFSAAAILSLQDRMTVSKSSAAKYVKSDYYASTLPPGPQRLAELIEESAFYSAPLQRASAKAMLAIIVLFAVLAAGIVLSEVPFVEHSTTLLLIRLILAAFVFAMSADVVGAYLAHKDAARRIEEVRARLMGFSDATYESDVLIAMADYNAAVESAPESIPFAYRFMEKDLNDKWADYQLNREAARAAADGMLKA